MESAHLKQQWSRERFDLFVFVSEWQRKAYESVFGDVFKEKAVVLRNAIEPFAVIEENGERRNDDSVDLITRRRIEDSGCSCGRLCGRTRREKVNCIWTFTRAFQFTDGVIETSRLKNCSTSVASIPVRVSRRAVERRGARSAHEGAHLRVSVNLAGDVVYCRHRGAECGRARRYLESWRASRDARYFRHDVPIRRGRGRTSRRF